MSCEQQQGHPYESSTISQTHLQHDLCAQRLRLLGKHLQVDARAHMSCKGAARLAWF